MSRRTFEDAGAQLDAALQDLGAAICDAFEPIVAGAARALRWLGAAIDRLLRRRGEITITLLPDTSRFEAALQLDRAQPDAGRRQLDAEQIAGVFGVPVAVLSSAGDLPTIELPAAGYACSPECRHRCGACRLGLPSHRICDPLCELHIDASSLHPSHTWAGAHWADSAERVECIRCGLCSCCDAPAELSFPCQA